MTENDRKYLRERLLLMSEYYDAAVTSPETREREQRIIEWMNETWLVLVDIVRKLDEEDKDGKDEGDIHRDA